MHLYYHRCCLQLLNAVHYHLIIIVNIFRVVAAVWYVGDGEDHCFVF